MVVYTGCVSTVERIGEKERMGEKRIGERERRREEKTETGKTEINEKEMERQKGRNRETGKRGKEDTAEWKADGKERAERNRHIEEGHRKKEVESRWRKYRINRIIKIYQQIHKMMGDKYPQ